GVNGDDKRTSYEQKIRDIAAPSAATAVIVASSGGIKEHVKKIEAIHGNSGGVDADAVVHIFPGRSPTYSYARKKYGTKRGGTLTGKNYLVLELVGGARLSLGIVVVPAEPTEPDRVL
ncbi:hypothetical protein THAOC_22084, partial [Thalassiosira oceanica]